MKKTANEIAKIAMCVCIIAVLSQVSIPFPSGVPLTFQTFAIAFCGWFLGLKGGLIALACYLAAGAAGVPVFSGFKAGIGVFLGPTGGFLYGFAALVAACGLALMLEKKTRMKASANALNQNNENAAGKPGVGMYAAVWTISCLGLLVCHACGVLNYCLVTGAQAAPAILSVSLPYLPKDLVSVVAAYYVARAINSRLKRTQAA